MQSSLTSNQFHKFVIFLVFIKTLQGDLQHEIMYLKITQVSSNTECYRHILTGIVFI